MRMARRTGPFPYCWLETSALFGVVRLRLLLRRGEALEALEQLLLAHVIDRHLGVVGIDRPAGARDQRNGIGFGTFL